MRAAQIFVAIALATSAAPAIAAPVPRAAAGAAAAGASKGISAFLKSLLKSTASSAALTAFFGLAAGANDKAARRDLEDVSDEDLEEILSTIKANGDFTQEELDQAEGVLSSLFAEDADVSKRAISATAKKEIADFFSDIIGSIVGKSGINLALGKNVDGSDKAKREVQLSERAALSGLLKPFLKSAGSSVALGGLLAGISSLFGGDKPAKRGDLAERSALTTLLKPFLKNAASSAAVGGFFGVVGKLLGGGDKAAKREVTDVDSLLAAIESSSELTQDQLNEIEAELEKSFGSVERRDLDARALRLGGLTKGLVGIIGSIAGSLGIDALLGTGKRATEVPSADEIVTMIENSDAFTQEQLDGFEAEFAKAFSGGVVARSTEARALRLGGLTKGLVGIIGSVVGSLGIDALLGNGKREYEGLNALD